MYHQAGDGDENTPNLLGITCGGANTDIQVTSPESLFVTV